MPTLHLDHLSKHYRRRQQVLKNLDLLIEGKEFVAVLGASESGKSTLLRMISGIEKATGGAVYINDVKVDKKTPSTGEVAMVFQNHALYPRMTVYENIAYSLKLQHMPSDQIQEKLMQMAELFQISEILQQKPAAISVEQRRIVAIARALVRDPAIVLLDEPFTGLDDSSRQRLRQMLQTIYQQMDAIFLYVTKNPAEAMALGTKIMILQDGTVQQFDTPQKVYLRPHNLFVAGLIGVPAMNVWKAKLSVACLTDGEKSLDVKQEMESLEIEGENPGFAYLQIGDLGKYSLSQEILSHLLDRGYEGKELIVGVRPERIRLEAGGSLSAVSSFYGMDDAGGHLYLESKDKQVTVQVERGKEPELGTVFFFDMDEDDLHFFDQETKERIF